MTAWNPDRTLGEELERAPFALTMSSGFFAFFAHTGFVTALEEAGLAPARVSGSSAGALVGASWAAGLSGRELGRELEALDRAAFWDPHVGPGLLRGARFQERMRRILPVDDFAKTRVPAAVSVFEVRARRTRVVAAGDIASAICASCAVPLMFRPVRIEGRSYLDGGILDRPGLAGMPIDAPRVLYHHIASRSPWRTSRWTGKEDLPAREGMLTFLFDALPRSGPFKLEAGRRALAVAREATKRALDRRLGGTTVVVETRG